jgi:hypothetical protein
MRRDAYRHRFVLPVSHSSYAPKRGGTRRAGL